MASGAGHTTAFRAGPGAAGTGREEIEATNVRITGRSRPAQAGPEVLLEASSVPEYRRFPGASWAPPALRQGTG